jgi:transcriptional regulator with XRE-family HTH domain
MHDVVVKGEKDVLDAQTSERLSARLRRARQMRGMTLKTLADAAGCSESLLSKIENGKAYPSLPMLNRLVKALDTTMGWLFDERDGKAPIIFRAGHAPAVPLVDDAITVERVIPDCDGRVLRANIVHVEAGASSAGEHQHAGEEAGYLLDGQIELLIDGLPHRLNPGDAFAFRADQPHSFRNIGSSRATVFWINTPSLT